MFRLIETDPAAEQVQQVTFVPFLPDGRCVLIERAEGPGLPAGAVLDGEDYLIDKVLRVLLQTAGFRAATEPSQPGTTTAPGSPETNKSSSSDSQWPY